MYICSSGIANAIQVQPLKDTFRPTHQTMSKTDMSDLMKFAVIDTCCRLCGNVPQLAVCGCSRCVSVAAPCFAQYFIPEDMGNWCA